MIEAKMEKLLLGQHIDGFTRYEELVWLNNMVKNFENIVEIGSWLGRTTYALCKGCSGIVYAVDHFKGSPEHNEILKSGLDVFKEFTKNTIEFNNLTVIKKSSKEAFEDSQIPEKVDAVFLDGSHLYKDVMEDLRMWYPRCRKMIIGHDINWEGVPFALYNFFGGIIRPEDNRIILNVGNGPVSIWYKEIKQCVPGEKNL
jgi:Methyltransferase domain